MCSTTTCCFSLPTPSSPSNKHLLLQSRNSRTSLVSPPSWQSRSVTLAAAMGLAQAMIGIGVIGNLYFFSGEGLAVTEDATPREVVKQRVSRVQTRWSDKRACPPWQSKTFELVVPENLPR
ncbi:hypothetical protein CDL15_Pgr015698 [Punica granatum]|nr:hypothetical protein CDL15_Pgr015698 [Punica granatum]